MDYTYNTTSAPTVTSSSDSAYNLGVWLSPFLFAAIIFLAAYWGVRLIKKRKPTKREKIIILIVAVGFTLLLVVTRALSGNATTQY